MATVPTGKMERELRRLYMQWVQQLPNHEQDLHNYVAKFQDKSMDLIEKMGGNVARLGALAGFPAPRRLDLSPHIGTIYSDMELAAISAQISLGLNPRQTAQELVRAGVDKSYRRLERLARTETVSAYWKNAWDSIEDLPELVMVWGAESGPRTCQWCLERDGMVMESSALRDHPNGRCTPIPTLRSMVEYKGSVDAGGRIYQDPAWTKASPASPSIQAPPESRPSVSTEGSPDWLDRKLAREWRFYDGAQQTDAMWSYDYSGMTALRGAMENLEAGRDALDGLDLTRFIKKAGNDFFEDGVQVLTEAQARRALELAARDILTRTPTSLPKVTYRGMYVPANTEFRVGDSLKLNKSSVAKNIDTVDSYTTRQTVHTFEGKGLGVILELRDAKGITITPNTGWDEMLTTGTAQIVSVSTDEYGIRRVVANYVAS